jgi:probable rRNA maturation factor
MFEIVNKTRKKISKSLVQKTVKETLKISKKRVGYFSLSIAFVEKKEIKNLNETYRKKNKATDVLSFSYGLGYNKRGKAPLGELVLCPDVITKQAEENEVTFQKELIFVLSHGVLHLLGMRHGKKMYELQDEIISKIKNKR